jgi:protein-S-isoprenylcysteine O-methyltransferase Ste14
MTIGPYRYVRHPLYSAGFVEVVALSVIAANWFMALVMVLGMVMILAVVIPREEAHLIGAFGDDYEAYRKRTGRLLPKW